MINSDKSSMQKNLSVIIITFNRPRKLYNCLKSIKNSNIDNIEVIVIDDANSGDTDSIVREFFSDAKIIKHERPLLPCLCLQEGLLNAQALIAARIDDDNVLPPDVLPKLVEVIASDDKIAFCGTVSSDSAGNLYAHAFRLSGITKRVVPIKVRMSENVGSVIDVDIVDNVYVFRRDLLNDIGGFSSCADYPWSMEDAIQQILLKKQGFKVMCCTDAIVFHDGEHRKLNALQIYYLVRSKIIFLSKECGFNLFYLFILMLIYLPGYAVSYASVIRNFREIKLMVSSMVLGLIDGLKAKELLQ